MRIVTIVCLLLTGIIAPVAVGDYLEMQKEKVLPDPSPDKAVVYFVRPATVGLAIRGWAFIDDEPVGVTKGKSYVVAEVDPGTHLFWSKAENVSALEMTVEGGETYYLKLKINMGLVKARIKLLGISDAEGEKAIKKCRYAQLTPEGSARGKELAAGHQDKAQKKKKKKGE